MLNQGTDTTMVRCSEYDKKGYRIFRNLLDSSKLREIEVELEGYIARRSGASQIFVDGKLKMEEKRLEDLREPHIDEPFWLNLCLNPRMLDILEGLLGPSLVLMMSHLFVKPPKEGLSIGWHQDGQRWAHIKGTDMATVWLALDDVDLGNGCMQVIPETHKGCGILDLDTSAGADYLESVCKLTNEQKNSAVPIELKAGDFSVHDAMLVHGSCSNTSNRRRAGYTMRYANADGLEIDQKAHWSPIYLVRGEIDWPKGTYVDVRPQAASHKAV